MLADSTLLSHPVLSLKLKASLYLAGIMEPWEEYPTKKFNQDPEPLSFQNFSGTLPSILPTTL